MGKLSSNYSDFPMKTQLEETGQVQLGVPPTLPGLPCQCSSCARHREDHCSFLLVQTPLVLKGQLPSNNLLTAVLGSFQSGNSCFFLNQMELCTSSGMSQSPCNMAICVHLISSARTKESLWAVTVSYSPWYYLQHVIKALEQISCSQQVFNTCLLNEEHRGIAKGEISGVLVPELLVFSSNEQDLRVRCHQKQTLAHFQRASTPSWLLLQSFP